MHPNTKLTAVLLGGALWLTAGALQAQTMPSTPSAMPASPAAASATSAAPAAAATASVSQAQFTTAINNREPADDITTLDNSHTQVFFFTVLKDAVGQTITHRWQYNGQAMAEVKFEPKANHWRVWSSKTLMPSQIGTWTVDVVDGNGNVLASKTLDYTATSGAAPNATHKVQPDATHKVTPANTQTPAPSATTHGGILG
jgi:hypothetical protein